MNLIERLLARQTGMADDRQPDPLCAEAAAEIERLCETTVLQAAAHNLLSEEIVARGKQIARLTRERDAALAALMKFACRDNWYWEGGASDTMWTGDQDEPWDYAARALEQQERSLDYRPITGKGVDALDRRTPEAMAQVQDYIRERVSTGEPVGLKPLIRRGEGESDGDTDLSAGSPVPTLEQTADNT